MKRPLAVTGFCMLLFMLLCIQLESSILALSVLIISAIGLVLSTFLKPKQALLCAAVCLGIGSACLLFLNGEYERQKTLSLCGEQISVQAVISEKPEFSHENGRYYAVAKLKSISGEKAYGKIRLSFSETYDEVDSQSLKIGDRITFNGNVYKIGESSSDIHKYFNSIGIYTGAYTIQNLKIEPPSHRPIYYYVSIVRDWLIQKISHDFDNETAGVIIAMLTGDKDFVSDELYTAFKKSGTAHIMAVSGMHLSVWIMFLGVLLDKLKRHRALTNLLLCSAVLFVMLLASFSPSVMRAGFMVLLQLSGRFIGRRTDGLNSLGFASIVLLCFNPYMAVNAGFQLSFMSVASIFLLGVPLAETVLQKSKHKIPTEMLKKMFSAVVTSLCISLSVILFTFPIMVMAFGGVSLVSPLTNVLLLPAATPLMILSGLYALFSFVPFISTVLALTVKLFASYTIKAVELTADLPLAYLPADYRYIIGWAVLVLTVIFAVFMLIRKRPTLSKASVAAIVIAFLFAFCNGLSTSLTQYQITTLPTENECSYIVTMNGRGVLVGFSEDYYFEKSLSEKTEELGITLDAAVLFDSTDEYGMSFIAAEHGIKHVLSSPGESVILFGEVRIENRGSFVLAEGNGISVGIFSKDYLQQQSGCDIILYQDGVLCPGESDGAHEYTYYSGEPTSLTVVVNENGEYYIRGESFG